MFRILLITALFFSFIGNSYAQDDQVKSFLDELEFKYEVDSDNDFKLTFEFEDDRSQLIFINGSIEVYQEVDVVEIWAPVMRFKGNLSKKVANKVLATSNQKKIGAFEIRESVDVKEKLLVYVTKIPLDSITAEQFGAFLHHVLVVADEEEKELTKGKDDW